MLASDILSDVQVELTDPNYARWSVARLVGLISDAQYELLTRRPDLRLKADGTLVDITTVDQAGTTLLVDETWKSALVDYVVYRALSEDDADTENLGRARMRLESWIQKLGV